MAADFLCDQPCKFNSRVIIEFATYGLQVEEPSCGALTSSATCAALPTRALISR